MLCSLPNITTKHFNFFTKHLAGLFFKCYYKFRSIYFLLLLRCHNNVYLMYENKIKISCSRGIVFYINMQINSMKRV